MVPTIYPTIPGNSSTFVDYGTATFDVEIDRITCEHQFHVVEMADAGILGMDFLFEQDAVIDAGRRRIFVRNKPVRIHDINAKPFHNKVVAAQTVDIRPGEGAVISGKVCTKGKAPEPYVYLEPAKMVSYKTGASLLAGVVKANRSMVGVGVYNITSQPIRIYRNTTLGVLHEFDRSVIWKDEEREKAEAEEQLKQIKSKAEMPTTSQTDPNYPRVSKVTTAEH